MTGAVGTVEEQTGGQGRERPVGFEAWYGFHTSLGS